MRHIFWIFLMAVSAWGTDDAIASPPQAGGGFIQRRLTLEQAVEMAIRANLDVEIERLNVDAAAAAVRAARGSYDPVFRWQPSFGDSNTPVPSVLQGSGGVLTRHSAGQTVGPAPEDRVERPGAGCGIQQQPRDIDRCLPVVEPVLCLAAQLDGHAAALARAPHRCGEGAY